MTKLSNFVLCCDNIILVFLCGNFVLFSLADLVAPSEGHVMNVDFNDNDNK